MNKILVAVAIACCAAMSQAASVDWKITGDTSGLLVYVCDAAKVPLTIAAASDIDKYLVGTDGNSGVMSGSRTIAAVGTANGIDNSLDGTTMNLAYVVVAADKSGYWTFNSAAQVYTTATEHQDSSFDAKGLTTPDTMKEFGGGPGPGPIPEPTSGLLMLLGMAGLALRRRA